MTTLPEYPSHCVTCGKDIMILGKHKHGICNDCLAEHDNKPKPTLRLFEAKLAPTEYILSKGFYVMVLAVNLAQAKTFIQAQFNIEYENAVIDTFQNVIITEIEGPFNAGTILASLNLGPTGFMAK